MVDILVTRPYGVGNAVQAIPALKMLLNHGKSVLVYTGNEAAADLLREGFDATPAFAVGTGAACPDCKNWISLWPWDSAVQPGHFERRFGYVDGDKGLLHGQYGDKVWDQNEVQMNCYIAATFLNIVKYKTPGTAIWNIADADTVKGAVGIHPGCKSGDAGVWYRKRWPVGNWVKLTSQLLKAGKRVKVFGQTADDGRGISALMGAFDGMPDVTWCVDRPSSEAAQVAGLCETFISNDSGMAHMAVAGGCKKVFVLYGPTSVNKNTHDGMASIVATGACKYAPCYTDHFVRPCEQNMCMRSISVERVLREVSI